MTEAKVNRHCEEARRSNPTSSDKNSLLKRDHGIEPVQSVSTTVGLSNSPSQITNNCYCIPTFASMAKVIKFPGAVPEKFGLQRARKVKEKKADKHGQLNLFTGGKVVRLSKLTPFEEALLMEEQGDQNAAIALYNKAIERSDSKADAYCNLGIIEFEKAHYPKAIDSFTNCLKLEPRHFEAHYNLANLYAEVGEIKLAKFHYEVSIEIEPTFSNSYFNLGLTLAMNKEYDEAVRILYQYRELTTDEDHRQVDSLIFTLQRSGGYH